MRWGTPPALIRSRLRTGKRSLTDSKFHALPFLRASALRSYATATRPANHNVSFPRAILDLKNQRDKLRQYQRRITGLTDRETEIAKKCLAQNDRRRALLALRRKKYQESLLAKTDSQLETLEKLVNDVEFALVQKSVLLGLQQGTEVLQAIHKEMGGIEGVEKLMGETDDARAYQEVWGCPCLCEVLSTILTWWWYRKSLKCLRVVCRRKMRTRSRMNWPAYNARDRAPLTYQMLLWGNR